MTNGLAGVPAALRHVGSPHARAGLGEATRPPILVTAGDTDRGLSVCGGRAAISTGRRHQPMIEPPIERILAKTDSRFSLVVLAARRARQINAYFNQLGEGLGSYVPPQVHSLSRKPLSISLEEIDNDKVVIQTESEEPEQAEE